jgi:hypothetical protein
MHRLSTDASADRIVQDGAKEYLLCEGCEQYLNENFEKAFDGLWMKSGRLTAGLKRQPPRVEDLPYKEFKLFHLSVLWRMGVAQTNGFEHFVIGAHADVLKAMIRDGDPGEPEVYPFGATALLDSRRAVVFDLVGAAERRKLGNLELATATFGGCSWAYMLTTNLTDIPVRLRSTLFRGDGTLPIEAVPYHQSGAIARHLETRRQK